MRFPRFALYALAAVLISPQFDGTISGIAAAQDESEAPQASGSSTSAYSPPDGAEDFKFEAEVNKMLDIVVNSLYQNKDVFLRELISNASDALDKIRFMSLTRPELLDDKAELEVRIEYDSDAKTLTVRDSGIGMTKDDLVQNLGTVARSGTTKFMEALEEKSADIGMIGQFGVGFYSAFLVADRVSVSSKHPESDVQYVWESVNGEPTFYVAPDPRGNTLGRGTEITLHLKEDAEEYADSTRIRNLSKHYSEFVTHPIHLRTSEITEVEIPDDDDVDLEVEDGEEKKEEEKEDDDLEVSDEDVDDDGEERPKKTKEVMTHSWEEVNSEQALWTRSKEDITEEEYQGFYRSLTKQDGEDASAHIHFSAEGSINFKSLLYLPSDVPSNLMQGNFDQERKGGLKLYVRKVLISDEFELMPKYLSFVKGVVDSDDLPLNVNRETLQESKIIKVISKKLVRKAIEMLRKLAEKDEAKEEKDDVNDDDTKEVEIDENGEVVETDNDELDDDDDIDRPRPYLDWYKKFAPSLKMGIMDDDGNQNKLAKLLRYKSSRTEGINDYVSLTQYVENMKEWQDEIYFFAGPDIAEMEVSHFMEQFQDKDVEVLYFTDPVDEYMSNNLREFGGKKFTSISREGIKFKDEDEDTVKRRDRAYAKKYKPLTKWLNKLFGRDVRKVSISKRLGRAPAIVSTSEYGHSANMERIMRAQAFQHGADENMMKAQRVLEINPRHPLVEKLLEGCPEEDGSNNVVEDSVSDAAWMLYDMALLNGGFPISESKSYNERMTRALQMLMGVDDVALSDEIDPPEDDDDEPPEIDMDSNNGINIEDFGSMGDFGGEGFKMDMDSMGDFDGVDI